MFSASKDKDIVILSPSYPPFKKIIITDYDEPLINIRVSVYSEVSVFICPSLSVSVHHQRSVEFSFYTLGKSEWAD